MDAADGEIVALEMRNDMKKELCIDTLKQLKARYYFFTATVEASIPAQRSEKSLKNGYDTESERYRSLLRQCTHGELLCHTEVRETIPYSDHRNDSR